MSFEQGYDAGNNGLIAAVNTAKMLGAIEERKRIIELLKTRTNDSGSVLDQTGNSIADLSDLIALINGENT